MKKKKEIKYYNIRLKKIGDKFLFDDGCYMFRFSKRPSKGYNTWVNASNRDRNKLKEIIKNQ